jgi:methyl-accepting chemotaxis protein
MDEIGAVVAMPQRAGLADRIGIIPRLLAGSFLALMVAVTSVQFWTLRAVGENGLQRAQDALGTSMAILKHELAPFGGTWATNARGQLLLGATELNGRNDLVDTVRDLSGAAATIFLEDTRIATNVKSLDGSRGIGTKLAPGPAHDAVLRDGRVYQGPGMILGKPYLTIYEPVRDAQARTIGILFVGVPLAEAEAFMDRITREAVIGAAVIALLAGLGYFWMLRTTVRPMTMLASVMRQIAGGALDCLVPSVRRTDQIGQMARAVQVFKDNMTETERLRSEQEAVKRLAATEQRVVVHRMADSFESKVGHLVGVLSAASTELEATAQSMTDTAKESNQQAGAVASAAEEASVGLQTVASAAEELTASITEISRQVAQSAQITGKAVADAKRTDEIVHALERDEVRWAHILR